MTDPELEDWPALTLRQPWAWAVMHRGPARKDVENRTWGTGYRGRLWVHAGWRRPEDPQVDYLRARLGPLVPPAATWASARTMLDDVDPGQTYVTRALLGHVELVDVTRDYRSPWAFADHLHWVLRDPVWLARPLPMRGGQGLWRPARRHAA